jgi:hypothetical protein
VEELPNSIDIIWPSGPHAGVCRVGHVRDRTTGLAAAQRPGRAEDEAKWLTAVAAKGGVTQHDLLRLTLNRLRKDLGAASRVNPEAVIATAKATKYKLTSPPKRPPRGASSSQLLPDMSGQTRGVGDTVGARMVRADRRRLPVYAYLGHANLRHCLVAERSSCVGERGDRGVAVGIVRVGADRTIAIVAGVAGRGAAVGSG